jgi:hypothetical protein
MPDQAAHEIARRRLRTQRLVGQAFGSIEETVGWLGALQAQEYGPAKWSIGQRTAGVTDGDLDDALGRGTILRTHVLRPTWHFVLPADIRWLMALTGSRIAARDRRRLAELELDERTLARARDVIAQALAGGRRLTRRQIAEKLAAAGIDPAGQRLTYIVMHAELKLLIVSGGLAGRQHTYALLDERVPPAPQPDGDEALAMLTRRYFTGHGPATIGDFCWWSSLTVAQAKRGLAMVESELERLELDGQAYWAGELTAGERTAESTDEPAKALNRQSHTVHLLQGFDEYIVGYRSTRGVIDAAGLAGGRQLNTLPFLHAVLVDGQLVGRWRRSVAGDRLTVEVRPLRPFTTSEQKAIEREVERYGRFVGLPATIGS